MRRRYRRDDSDLEDLFSGLFGLSILGSLGLYVADRTLFYKAVAGLVVLIILVVVGAILWGRYRDRKRDEKYQVITKDYGSVLNNFLDQFGRAKAKEAAFTYQQYAFTRERLTYMQDDLAKHGVVLSTKDFYRILRRFIDERERDFTLKSVHSGALGRFNDLDGAGFEALIKRLYEGAGYTAQLTGRSGDQGADLVVVRDDAKKVIQAKLRRKMTVGNDAVQQVVAAKAIYNCPEAVVITNSSFTPKAQELARVHGVELVDGKLLRLRLQETLGESWT
jgi:restriction endonuclease Mrr